MSILGYKAGPMRAPLTECSDEHKEGLKKAMKEYGIFINYSVKKSYPTGACTMVG